MKKKPSFVFGVLFSALLLLGNSSQVQVQLSRQDQISLAPRVQQLAILPSGPGDEGPKMRIT